LSRGRPVNIYWTPGLPAIPACRKIDAGEGHFKDEDRYIGGRRDPQPCEPGGDVRLGACQMNSAVLSALSALAGSTIGAIASIATTWLTQVYQNRTQLVSAGISQREHLFSDFITLASKLYADALTHEAPDPPTLVPLYALKAQMSLFATKATIDRADEVMRRIVDTYYKPNRDFHTRQAFEDSEYDLLRDFTLSCRAELATDISRGAARGAPAPMKARKLAA
jgi:hypothetical protein